LNPLEIHPVVDGSTTGYLYRLATFVDGVSTAVHDGASTTSPRLMAIPAIRSS
jgi:hypothetical protein